MRPSHADGWFIEHREYPETAFELFDVAQIQTDQSFELSSKEQFGPKWMVHENQWLHLEVGPNKSNEVFVPL